MDPIALLAAFCVLGSIVIGLTAVANATASPRDGMDRRLGRLMGESLGTDVGQPGVAEGLRRVRKGRLPLIGSFMEGRSGTGDLALDLERADLKLTPSEFVALRIFMAAIFAILPFLILGGLLGLAAAVGLGFVGNLLPKLWLGRRKSGRLSKLESQLPDLLSMLANSLKAGFGLMQSMDLASKEVEHPMSTELRRMLQDISIGMSNEDALVNFARRSGSPDLDIVVTAMLVQQSTGGNLSEILENVGHTMRERIRIRGEIKTLTTQGMMTGYIIGGLPIFIGLAVSVMNPEYIEPLYSTLSGQVMLGGAAVLELFGVLVIRKILAVEV